MPDARVWALYLLSDRLVWLGYVDDALDAVVAPLRRGPTGLGTAAGFAAGVGPAGSHAV